MRLAALLLFATAGAAHAQLVTDTRVNLRATASTAQPPLRVLPRGAALDLDSASTPTNGFYPVVTQQGQHGWVSEDFVSFANEADATALLDTPDATVISLASPLEAIDPDWERNPRRGSTMRHATKNLTCRARGADGGDAESFTLKNRIDIPAVSRAVSWTALHGLPHEDGAGVGKDRPVWTQQQRDDILRVEGIALTVTGFLAAAKAGSSEGTNCKFTGEANTDWHIAFTEHFDDPEAKAMVVEPTPRLKRSRPGWNRTALKEWIGDRRDPTDSVRITGFLFYDPDHRAHIIAANPNKRFRYTMWELHPITKIEVFSNGTWVDIKNAVP